MIYGLVCFRFSLVRLGYSLCLLLGGVAGVFALDTVELVCMFGLLFSLMIAGVFVWINSVGICGFTFCIVDCCVVCLVVYILWICLLWIFCGVYGFGLVYCCGVCCGVG